MAAVKLFDVIPEELTYPNVTPRLIAEAFGRVPRG